MNISEVVIHPVFHHIFQSIEHPEEQYTHIGDALGRDCMITRFKDGWMRMYDGEGTRNEDWYTWGADVLAPFDGVVKSVYINPITNTPGTLIPGRASSIVFAREDGVLVTYAHVMDIHVTEGDRITVGQVVAKAGNNGYSRHPHIHVGAWIGETPLQVRFDLQAMGRQMKALGERHYLC
ncbi:M23 family metallopeptidase [Paenibacillus sp. PR3]|uniref:M23 family metallopeptidase n=1 Tax=Paenibacillus terricola TaxID=2763503 RepID=A0ABR8MV65_9BACL|nr:M23 family metallopeptidase [Paenibacillus terricola]MBD3919858.1 M23 family metallopeptidase [Paenibacillus terricola]